MSYFDFYKLCQVWSQQQSADYPDDAIQGRPNLDCLKLTVEDQDISWTGFRPLVNEESQKVSVEFDPMKPNLYSGLQASKESELITEVQLTDGVAKGINKPLRLPVPGQGREIHKVLGGFVDIDPSTNKSRSSDKMTVKLGSSHLVNNHQLTQAKVSTKLTSYEVSFTAKVVCRGIVTFSHESTDEQTFPQIIADLQVRGQSGGLAVIKNARGFADSVSWTMSGRCVFRGEFEQGIDWQNSQ